MLCRVVSLYARRSVMKSNIKPLLGWYPIRNFRIEEMKYDMLRPEKEMPCNKLRYEIDSGTDDSEEEF